MSRRRRIWLATGLIAAACLVPLGIATAPLGIACYLRITSYHGGAGMVPYARRQLGSEDALVRSEAARALGSIGPQAEPATPELLSALRNDVPQVASSAAWALGNILPPNAEVVEALIGALSHEDGEVRRYAAYAISLHGQRAKPAVPELRRKLGDDHIASMAARALGEMGPASRDAIPEMTALLSSANAGMRAETVLALSKLRPLPEKTVETMTRLLNDDEPMVRDAAHRALPQ